MVDINIKLKDDERKRLGADLLEKITKSRNGMRRMFDKLDVWRRFYESDLAEKNFPWEDCSNVNVPLTQWIVDTYHARINDIILGVKPYTLIKHCEPADKPIAPLVEDILYEMESKYMKLRDSLDETFLESLLSHTAIGKVTWREEYRTVWDDVPVMDDFTGQPMIDPETGRPVTKRVEYQEAKYRGPSHDLVDLKNFVIYPLTSKDVESAALVGDRYRLSPDEVRRRVKQGVFNKDWTDEIIDRPSNELSSVTDGGDEHEDIKRQDIEAVDYDEFKFWEVIAGYDANGDGLLEDCVFVLEEETGTIVRAIQFPYKHGRRYYIRYRCFGRAKRFFGIPLAQKIEHMQRELNTIHNQRSDATTLAISKAFKKRKSGELMVDDVRVHPGAVIEVTDQDDLEELVINPLIPGGDIEAIALDYAERSSAVNDAAAGRETDSKKTLGEIQLVSNQGGLRLGDAIERLQPSVIEVGEQVIGLMYQFMSDEEIAELTGTKVNPLHVSDDPMTGQQVPKVTRADLRKRWDFIAHGNTGTSDKNGQREAALNMYMLLLGMKGAPPNPLVIQDPMRIYNVTRDLLNSFDRDNTESYIGTEQDIQVMKQQQAMQQQMMAQQQMEQQAMAQQQMAMQQQQQMQQQAGQQDVDGQMNQAKLMQQQARAVEAARRAQMVGQNVRK